MTRTCEELAGTVEGHQGQGDRHPSAVGKGHDCHRATVKTPMLTRLRGISSAREPSVLQRNICRRYSILWAAIVCR